MDRDVAHVIRKVTTGWDNLLAASQRMYPSCSVRPQTASEIFKLDEATPPGEVKFNVDPVVFNVPEQAGKPSNLYIAMKGWLSFSDVEVGASSLKTKSFGTELGYFRFKSGVLEHIYGVHYDLDERSLGHPVFHAQVSSQANLSDPVIGRYHLSANLVNKFSPVFSNSRIPSAQMDIFSAVLQICADHHFRLGGANATTKALFKTMQDVSSFFVGAAHRMPYLNQEPARSCYRSKHWYLV